VNGIAGTALVGGTGIETVNNYGVVRGLRRPGRGGEPVFKQPVTGAVRIGTQVNVGADGTFNNSGNALDQAAEQPLADHGDRNFAQSGKPKWLRRHR